MRRRAKALRELNESVAAAVPKKKAKAPKMDLTAEMITRSKKSNRLVSAAFGDILDLDRRKFPEKPLEHTGTGVIQALVQ